MEVEIIRAATGMSIVIGKEKSRIQIGNGYELEVYHAPNFTRNILSVGVLTTYLDILFTEVICVVP